MKLVGERKALAAAVFFFYALLYAVVVLSGAFPPEFSAAFGAIAGVYGLAFFALVAGYFWARWYAVGVGLYGVITGALGLWQLGPEPIILFMGGTHLAAAALLWGETMSGPFDGRLEWRARFHMDDHAVQRLGRSVIRAGVSLPMVLLYALAPKQPGAATVVAIGALVLTGVGLHGLVKLKTWGVIALAAAGTLLVSMAGLQLLDTGVTTSLVKPALGGILLIAAAVPFVPAMLRYARRQ